MPYLPKHECLASTKLKQEWRKSAYNVTEKHMNDIVHVLHDKRKLLVNHRNQCTRYKYWNCMNKIALNNELNKWNRTCHRSNKFSSSTNRSFNSLFGMRSYYILILKYIMPFMYICFLGIASSQQIANTMISFRHTEKFLSNKSVDSNLDFDSIIPTSNVIYSNTFKQIVHVPIEEHLVTTTRQLQQNNVTIPEKDSSIVNNSNLESFSKLTNFGFNTAEQTILNINSLHSYKNISHRNDTKIYNFKSRDRFLNTTNKFTPAILEQRLKFNKSIASDNLVQINRTSNNGNGHLVDRMFFKTNSMLCSEKCKNMNESIYKPIAGYNSLEENVITNSTPTNRMIYDSASIYTKNITHSIPNIYKLTKNSKSSAEISQFESEIEREKFLSYKAQTHPSAASVRTNYFEQDNLVGWLEGSLKASKRSPRTQSSVEILYGLKVDRKYSFKRASRAKRLRRFRDGHQPTENFVSRNLLRPSKEFTKVTRSFFTSRDKTTPLESIWKEHHSNVSRIPVYSKKDIFSNGNYRNISVNKPDLQTRSASGIPTASILIGTNLPLTQSQTWSQLEERTGRQKRKSKCLIKTNISMLNCLFSKCVVNA